MYGFNNGFAYGAEPQMRQRLDAMQQNYQPNYQNYPQQPQQTINGRIVTSIEEARAAQIPLDGTQVYFPAPAENEIYVKYIDLNGMPIFNVYKLATVPQKVMYADANVVQQLQQRVEQLENLLKGVKENVQSNANDELVAI